MPTQTKKPDLQERIRAMHQARLDNPLVHLWRGAPATRTWSKYQQTVQAWSVCGTSLPERATENADECTCKDCLQLLGNPRRGV
jgi:hypothetical protein